MSEIIYAVLLNTADSITCIMLLSMVVAVIAYGMSFNPDDSLANCVILRLKKVATFSICITVMCLPLTWIPSPEDLWRVRINMIKYHAASPDNIEKYAKYGLPHIERIVKKIECKYLDCSESIDTPKK